MMICGLLFATVTFANAQQYPAQDANDTASSEASDNTPITNQFTVGCTLIFNSLTIQLSPIEHNPASAPATGTPMDHAFVQMLQPFSLKQGTNYAPCARGRIVTRVSLSLALSKPGTTAVVPS